MSHAKRKSHKRKKLSVGSRIVFHDTYSGKEVIVPIIQQIGRGEGSDYIVKVPWVPGGTMRFPYKERDVTFRSLE